MDRLTAMQVFVHIVDEGSLTAAAEATGMSRAMVSRYLESLEQWLDTRLMHRTTRRLSLTDAGEEALSRCRQVLELADDARVALGARRGQPTGKLRMTTSESFAQAHLATAVAEFVARHPGTQIDLLTVDRAVNLVEERVDLAIRITNRLDDHYVARKLTVCRSVICATPEYVRRYGLPTKPEDLKLHRCITHVYGAQSQYKLKKGTDSISVAVGGPINCTETSVVRQVTLGNAGIAMLPTYLVSEDLIAGRLVQVLEDYEPEVLGIHAIYLTRRHQPTLLRAMIAFLADYFGEDSPKWDVAWFGRPQRRKAAIGVIPRAKRRPN